jgi:hypothetical protein
MKLELDEKTAKEIFTEASDAIKTILIKNFGDKCFRKTDFKDFKSFEDLCQASRTTEVEFNRKWVPTQFDPSTIAFEKLKILTRAYNQDWPFDAYNTNQKKWYPWFEVLSSGFGFSFTVYICDGADSDVGSRLCFESEEKAIHAGKNFTRLFEEFITAKY